jgi:CheY-like chemotaxis protein
LAAPLAYTLVVGLENEDRAWVEATLLRGGLAVATATEGDVLATPRLEPPRLVVLDDCGDAVSRVVSQRRLQLHPPLVGVPILVLAWDGGVESYTAAITRGASAYLVKPVSPQELVEVARRLAGWQTAPDRTERRRRLRRPMYMKVELHLRSRGVRKEARLCDASGGGCCLELDEALPAGEPVRVVLQAGDASTHVGLGAEVRWTRPAEAGGHRAGLRFSGSTAPLAAKLLGFVRSDPS